MGGLPDGVIMSLPTYLLSSAQRPIAGPAAGIKRQQNPGCPRCSPRKPGAKKHVRRPVFEGLACGDPILSIKRATVHFNTPGRRYSRPA